ncbi:MAG: molybdopterin-dependent oxidoreductase [Nostocoides sp.]
MATGHLVAAVVNPAASPVLAIGSTVIDATPTPVKDWAVRNLGTNDKPVLLGSVALGTVVLAAVIGLVSRRHPRLGALLVVALAGLAGVAALSRPTAQPTDVVPSLVAAGIGAIVLLALGRTLERPAGGPRPVESPLDHTAYAPGSAGRSPRRSFLVGAVGVAGASVAVGALGQRLGGGGGTLPSSIALPQPTTQIPALPVGLEGGTPGLSPFRTAAKDFYRVDTALVVPRVDAERWQLRVEGSVDHPFTLSYKELLAMPMVERDITLNCVSNEVGGPYISSTRWLGVSVKAILERAGLRPGVQQILSTSTDGMTISTPVEALTDDRGALVAVAMDGQPLPAAHGFPARLVTPGLYGYVGATKWLTRLTATTYAAERAYWTKRGWAIDAPVKTQARIDVPQGLATQPAGRVAIAGVAWSQATGGIGKVEVKVDDGPWREAKLGPDAGTVYWRQWVLAWDATSGRHQVTVRATDSAGQVQTTKDAPPFPNGASGEHSVVVLIS